MRFFISFLILNYFLLLKEYVELTKHFSRPLKSGLPTIIVFNYKTRINIEIVLHKFLHSGAAN